MNSTSHPLSDSQVVLPKMVQDKFGLWVTIVGCWLVVLVCVTKAWTLSEVAFNLFWVLGGIAVSAAVVDILYNPGKELAVQPSKREWSLTRRSLLAQDQVETYSANDVERIELTRMDSEGGEFWMVEFCSRGGIVWT